MGDDTGGWSRSELYVKEKLTELSGSVERTRGDLEAFKLDTAKTISELKTKMAMWIAIGSAVGAAAMKKWLE